MRRSYIETDSEQAPGTNTTVALTIAGSDSSGGAGIQADLKTFAAMGCFGTSALTAVTAQNTTGVKAAQLLDVAMVRQQIAAVTSDFTVGATKTGMLGSAEIIEAVAEAIEAEDLRPFVLDPVMRAKGGDPLIDDDAVQTLIRRLVPLATVVTPNKHEAAVLTNMEGPIATATRASMAAERICRKLGAKACVVKGVRRERHGRCECVDVFFDGHRMEELISPWYGGPHTHGSGCTFSAAVTAGLALGHPLERALDMAKQFIYAAIDHEVALGHGHGPVNHLAWLMR